MKHYGQKIADFLTKNSVESIVRIFGRIMSIISKSTYTVDLILQYLYKVCINPLYLFYSLIDLFSFFYMKILYMFIIITQYLSDYLIQILIRIFSMFK